MMVARQYEPLVRYGCVRYFSKLSAMNEIRGDDMIFFGPELMRINLNRKFVASVSVLYRLSRLIKVGAFSHMWWEAFCVS